MIKVNNLIIHKLRLNDGVILFYISQFFRITYKMANYNLKKDHIFVFMLGSFHYLIILFLKIITFGSFNYHILIVHHVSLFDSTHHQY